MIVMLNQLTLCHVRKKPLEITKKDASPSIFLRKLIVAR
jgi:hypothetical protein